METRAVRRRTPPVCLGCMEVSVQGLLFVQRKPLWGRVACPPFLPKLRGGRRDPPLLSNFRV